ncbi:hypothetical protein PF005_g13464 [Phytophthora fragariae]|uniref:Uncharacterized protein n=1 Tax=Phytophthora fragariae TaxID=53985 RepID=A0A6A4DMC6_9STRA|nr:hypothetical protein PF003_g10234 [Phytophthora fragariae]KAE8935218.1 hypothetical protein PF009_g14821 [Phytophthora fragariae]KAE9109171.1 hypothetical protein PF007_g12350 [Phytophthora fragariae]KAE9142176.1 hypothetical protein PF006_g12693 [Phytophthora fragariae]KAE9205273.1 hypothetical protein PF005_g13464 [Phytophthora fragariae]
MTSCTHFRDRVGLRLRIGVMKDVNRGIMSMQTAVDAFFVTLSV